MCVLRLQHIGVRGWVYRLQWIGEQPKWPEIFQPWEGKQISKVAQGPKWWGLATPHTCCGSVTAGLTPLPIPHICFLCHLSKAINVCGCLGLNVVLLSCPLASGEAEASWGEVTAQGTKGWSAPQPRSFYLPPAANKVRKHRAELFLPPFLFS